MGEQRDETRMGVTNLPLGGKRGPMCGNESGVLSRPGLARLNRNMRHITRHFSTRYTSAKRYRASLRTSIAVSRIDDQPSGFSLYETFCTGCFDFIS